jgi:hypothetical protein
LIFARKAAARGHWGPISNEPRRYSSPLSLGPRGIRTKAADGNCFQMVKSSSVMCPAADLQRRREGAAAESISIWPWHCRGGAASDVRSTQGRYAAGAVNVQATLSGLATVEGEAQLTVKVEPRLLLHSAGRARGECDQARWLADHEWSRLHGQVDA